MQLYDYQINLIERVRAAWRAGYRRPCIVLPCGGGKSIICADMAKRTTERGKRVLFLVHRRELCDQIARTFREYGADMALCDVEMVQTAARHTERIAPPALIITDENHHCLAAGYRRVYAAFPEARCVGVTATPVRLNGGGLGEINDVLIEGPSVRELLEQARLASYDCYAPSVAELSGMRSRNGDYAAEDVMRILDKPKIYGDVVRHYTELANGKRAICYCSTIEHSETMAEAFRAAGIPALHIDGNTPKSERERAIRAFREGKIRILCNVDLISEGFDVPDCGASILLRPTKSLTLYLQQAMRCMRYQPGKRAVILDHVGNVHRHGLPDMERKWTLDPKPPAKKEKSEIFVRQCTRCFYTHKPAPVCPNCGFVYERTIRERKEEQAAKLARVVEGYASAEECGSVSELYAFAKNRGYKPGWAYYRAKQRGFLR